MATALGRILNAVFFLVTAIYCILTYSPFAYEQFIQPNMIAWLANFVFLHTDFYWLVLCVTLLTMVPHLKQGRVLGWAYLIAAAVGGVVMSVTTVLPSGHTPVRSIAVALLALAPVIWLGVFDHLTAGKPIASPVRDEARAQAAWLAAALFAWALFAALAPMRLREAGGVSSSAAVLPLAIGAGVSLVAHLTAFTIASLVLASSRALGVPTRAAGIAALAVILQRVVLAPLSVAGAVSWMLAAGLAVALVAFVSGVARQLPSPRQTRAAAVMALAALPPFAFAALSMLTTFDWGFMLQKLAALVVALVAWKAIAALFGDASRPRAVAARLPLAILAFYTASLFVVPRLHANVDFALDAYSAADPSFRLLRQFLETDEAGQGDASFYAYLRGNSSIKEPVAPVSIDFTRDRRKLEERPPNVFLFVIDSLRRDYVSVYNPKVTFTPRLAAFAADSVVFTRAFSRYGGTGLAVPSIWSGALVAHKQYVTPFAPMNALAKLLDAGGYRRVITRDHITEELFGLEEGTSVLDHRIPEMMHTFCGTMKELTEELHAHADDQRPVFAHTRPLDLHIGNTRYGAVPPGESYPGFFPPTAARVHQIDRCFGEFVDDLKRTGQYDDSIIIVMADHGDSLGEGLRWGHGYTIVPEVLRIPLLIRLPKRLSERFAVDPWRVAFGSDVTPSLYALLGRPPERPRGAAGTSLFVPAGADPPSRRNDPFLVASSYGAVYGIVRHNGRRLYIADAIEGRDSMYDLTPGAGDARIGMTDAERQANRAMIREQIEDLAAWYGMPR